MLTEQFPTLFQVVICGVPYGTPQSTRSLAENLLIRLTPDQQLVAEIRPVSQTGKQLLLG